MSLPPTDPAKINTFLHIISYTSGQVAKESDDFKKTYEAHYESMRVYPNQYGLILFDSLAPNVDDKTEWNTLSDYNTKSTVNERRLYNLLINSKMQNIIFNNPNDFAGLMNAVSLSIKYNGKFNNGSFAGKYGTLNVIRKWLTQAPVAKIALQRLCLESYRPIDLCQSKPEPESSSEPSSEPSSESAADDALPPASGGGGDESNYPVGGEGESNTLMWILLFVFIVIVAIVGGFVWFKMRSTGGQDILNE